MLGQEQEEVDGYWLGLGMLNQFLQNLGHLPGKALYQAKHPLSRNLVVRLQGFGESDLLPAIRQTKGKKRIEIAPGNPEPEKQQLPRLNTIEDDPLLPMLQQNGTQMPTATFIALDLSKLLEQGPPSRTILSRSAYREDFKEEENSVLFLLLTLLLHYLLESEEEHIGNCLGENSKLIRDVFGGGGLLA